MGRRGGQRCRRSSRANLTSTSTGQRGGKRRRLPPPANSFVSIAADLGNHGLIMVLFETPSGFAIFYFDGISLYEPDAMENIWAHFVTEYRASHVIWRKDFQVFKDKSDAINHDSGLNNQLTNMLLKWYQPGQKLAVGKIEYKIVIEANLGISCLFDEPVMELMRGLNYLMHSVVPEEKSKLAEEHCLQTSQGLKMLLHRYGFDIKPEMVNDCIIVTACNLYDSDCCLKNQFKSLRLASHFLQDVSSINFQDWDILKLATALKMVCYPEDDILFGNPDEMFSTDELSKLVADAHKYEDSGIIKGAILRLYNLVVYLLNCKAKYQRRLASFVKEAKESYEAEQVVRERGSLRTDAFEADIQVGVQMVAG
ncbi:unnamed protein product [Triticum turgidum subsp. durum]|uniref:Nucleolar protein 58/56 N-terminal domain-containing protein n=3 Tax=Triticum TaxID=4564 RepID=A0A9R0X5B9_TRITD|nr:unnamed protein product [Triticum turgidum subsp. durum]